MSRGLTVLVVDDEKAHRLMLRAHLEEAGYQVVEAGDGQEALSAAANQEVDLALLDLVMPRMDGNAALVSLKRDHPGLPVIMMTAFGSIQGAVDALKAGAEDFLTKPLDVDEVLIKVERALGVADLTRRVADQAERLGERFDFTALIGQSPPMRRLKDALALVAPAEATVLIRGESGTGKEVAAQVIHQNSPRAEGPLVKVNCAALPENLLESELFGHEKGAFTGAVQRRKGRFAAAHGGSVFLDEIGEMSPALQARLLRVLQEGEFSPVGSNQVLSSDARVIAATNRDLSRAVENREFREDLYYRLNVINLEMPPLRERGGDIMLLAEHFLLFFGKKNRRRLEGFSREAQQALLSYFWPGNVRELANTVERTVIMSPGTKVQAEDLPGLEDSQGRRAGENLHAGLSLKQAERALITKTLEANGGNRTQAARMLGITRKTLQNKIKEYGLPPAS